MICCSAGPLTLAVVVLVALPCGFPSACSYVLVKRSVSGGRQKWCGLSAWLVGLCARHGCFQGTEKWRRSSEAIEPLWASCCCSRSLLWLSGHSGKKWPSKAFLLLALCLSFSLLALCFSFSLVPMPCVASPSSGAVVMGQAVPQAADGGVGISKNRGAAVLTADKTVSLFSG